MAAAALLACSKEQVIEQNRANDEIGFSVAAENQTKAEDVYTRTNLMSEFFVSATYNNGSETSWYFQNDKMTKVQNGEDYAWENTTDTRYWSADGKHDFYAIVNGDMTMAATPAAPTVNFTPATTVASQKDLLYAVQYGQRKSDSPVELNFRHALSQIQFKAINTNPQLHVKISGVQVGNTPGVGTFTYPTTAGAAGSWVVNTPTDYTVEFTTPVGVAGNNTSVDLTCTNVNSMLLIPATTVAWIPTTPPAGGDNGEEGEGGADGGDPGNDGGYGEDGEGPYEGPEPGIGDGIGGGEADPLAMSMRRYNTASAGASDVTGSYLAVKCEIYNVAGGTYDKDTDVCIYNGWAMIPAKFEWAQGNKYIYTFVFGEGDFGYNGGNGDTPTPTPGGEKVLTAMNYTVSVDNFTPVAENEMNMKR